MKRSGLLLAVCIAVAAPLSAQGGGRVGLASRPYAAASLTGNQVMIAGSQGGLTHSERGALIGAAVGIIAGAILSAHYDEKGAGQMLVAGLVMAIPVSLIGALIGLM